MNLIISSFFLITFINNRIRYMIMKQQVIQATHIHKIVKKTKTPLRKTIILTILVALFFIVFGMLVKGTLKTTFYAPKQCSLTQKCPSYSINKCGDQIGDWIEPRDLGHKMNDEQVMWLASRVPYIKEYPYKRTPKVAFLFLTRKMLPFAPLWELFFKGHQGFYSIYIHTSLEYESFDEPIQSSVFYKRRIPSKSVEWGTSSMIDAERRLLANALLDISNERFILLSESCIPLFNFTTIYTYLINSKQTFVGSFDDPRKVGRGRYNTHMGPTILLSDWRKGNQWFEVNRKLGIQIISDVIFYPILRDYCKGKCYMDEHYLATFVTKVGKGLNSNRSITWVDWSKPGSHPTTFVKKDISQVFLNRIRGQNDCVYNGVKKSICFLFARKFHPNTLEPLLRIVPSLFGFNG